MNKRILCIGAAHIDYKMLLKETLRKETSNPITKERSFGGVVYNVGMNLSKLALDVSLMSLLGKDTNGVFVKKHIEKAMDASLITQIKGYDTGEYYALIDRYGHMSLAFANMEIYKLMNKEWIMKNLQAIRSYDFVVADMNLQTDALNVLVESLDNNHLTIVGVSEPKMKKLVETKNINLLISNLGESRYYFNDSSKGPRELIQLWMNKGVSNVVITSGDKDLFFGNHDGIGRLPTLKIEKELILNVTGAGDAFSGGVIYGLSKEKTLKEACIYGLCNAGLNIQSSLSVREDINIEKLLMEVKHYESIS